MGNDLNKESFGTKTFVHNDDHYVYTVADVFLTDIEVFKQTFVDYMHAMNWAIVQFREQTDEAMRDEENSASDDPTSWS